jgi:hypothetical protein
MAGGLLNLISHGNQNIILNGNPSKTFFKTTYAKYTNFGMQKFRIDQIGQKTLQLSQITKFSFKIPRHADLLMDSYLVINLPNIYSPVIQDISNGVINYREYNFKWIKNLGSQLIKQVEFTIGGHIIQKYTGNYIQNVVERDFDLNKKELFDKMTGNVSSLNDPSFKYNGKYPNAYKRDLNNNDIEPSIFGRTLYIPINSWFSLSSKMAFPLISLQYSELVINFELRPIHELFVVRDIDKSIISHNDANYIYPLLSDAKYQFKRFINPPPDISLEYNTDKYDNLPSNYNRFDVHLNCTYCFLDNDEVNYFAKNNQDYLIKEIYEKQYDIQNTTSGKLKIESYGLVSSWMWYLQRSDVNLRNEWSNYTNYPYEGIKPNELLSKSDDIHSFFYTGYLPDRHNDYSIESILEKFAIICDGKYRENEFDSGIYNYIEKYTRTHGNAKDGLYCYNFCIDTNPYLVQPSGSFNTNKFKTIEFEYKLISRHDNSPLQPFDPTGEKVRIVCDGDSNSDILISVNDATSLYKYKYNFYLIEERYNVLKFSSGHADLVYSR